MVKNSSQGGSVHTLIVIILALGLVVSLGFAFWRSYSGNQVGSEAGIKKEGYKTYTSLSSSGLTFDYPSTWWFEPPTEQTISRSDSKATILLLSSKQPSVVDGRSVVEDGSVCITFNEMQGSWPFRYKPLRDTEVVAEFTVGENEVSLVENKAYLESGDSSAIQLLNRGPDSEHGASYVALKDNYYLLATAHTDCFADGDTESRDMTKEIEQARIILKSVRLAS